jgi:nucleoid DNA-binding protein
MDHKETLTKNNLLNLAAKRLPDIPQKVTKLAGEIIFETLLDALGRGRPVSLRGFGRFIPRHYNGGRSGKKFGLLFHPSPRLLSLVNKDKTTEKEGPPFFNSEESSSEE